MELNASEDSKKKETNYLISCFERSMRVMSAADKLTDCSELLVHAVQRINSEFHIALLRTILRCIEMILRSVDNVLSASLSTQTKQLISIAESPALNTNGIKNCSITRHGSLKSGTCGVCILSKQQHDDLVACYEKVSLAIVSSREILERTINLEVVKATESGDTVGNVKRMLPIAPSGNCRNGTRSQSAQLLSASRTSIVRDISQEYDDLSTATS